MCRCIPGTEGDADIECHTSEYFNCFIMLIDTVYKCTYFQKLIFERKSKGYFQNKFGCNILRNFSHSTCKY